MKNVNQNIQLKSFSSFEDIDFFECKKYIKRCLTFKKDDYPEILDWFDKILGEKLQRRKILVMYIGNEYAGFAILKVGSEQKICTFFIVEKFRGQGLGSFLLNEACKLFKGKKIILSFKQKSFQGFFEKYGFSVYKFKENEIFMQKILESVLLREDS